MRFFLSYLILLCTVPLVLLGCITKDSPPPSKLQPPTITSVKTVGVDNNGFPSENIRVEWSVPFNESLSVANFKLLRKLLPISDTGNATETERKNIPGSVTVLLDSVATIIKERIENRTILYSILSIDSLGRVSDTSEVCSLTVVKSAILLYPQYSAPDTLDKFKWEISSIPSQVITNAELWQYDSLLWQSTYDTLFTGGNSKTITKLLPAKLLPLPKGNYMWGVKLLVNNSNNLPASYTFRSLTIE